MKITKQEVKTIYTIEVTCKDIIEITKNVDSVKRLSLPKMFEGCNLDDRTIGNMTYILKSLGKGHGDTTRYVADALGFDGIENHGYYKESIHAHVMVVYNNGDCVNR